MKKLINRTTKNFFMLTALLSFVAHAGDKVGNGGDGVIGSDGKIYALDLVESGVERNPFFSDKTEDLPFLKGSWLKDRLSESINFVDETALNLLAIKTAEYMNVVSTADSLSFLGALRNYRWILLDTPLVNIPDEDTNLLIPEESLIQVAIRRGHTIQIDRAAFEKMDAANKVALIVHEIIYALIAPQKVVGEWGQTWYEQSSPKVREIVGYMFTPQFASRGLRGFTILRLGLRFNGNFYDHAQDHTYILSTDLNDYTIRRRSFVKMKKEQDFVCSYRGPLGRKIKEEARTNDREEYALSAWDLIEDDEIEEFCEPRIELGSECHDRGRVVGKISKVSPMKITILDNHVVHEQGFLYYTDKNGQSRARYGYFSTSNESGEVAQKLTKQFHSKSSCIAYMKSLRKQIEDGQRKLR